MWTVIYIAPSINIAERYQQAFADEGILVQLKPVTNLQHISSTHVSVEILVPESEAEEAHEILTHIIGG